MTKLGAFLESIRNDARATSAIAAAGLMAVLSASQAVAGEGLTQAPRIAIHDIYEANDLNERVSDQLNSMKPLSDALQYSVSSSSANVSGIQKAKNLAIAFEYSLQKAAHPDRAAADGYFVTTEKSAHVSQELREMVEIVNTKKMELLEFAATIREVEKALAYGDHRAVELWGGRLAIMADDVEEKLHSDISFEPEEDTSASLAQDI